jgi:aminopeptidase N
MERWVRQKGYPVITASRQRNKVFLSQRRFLLCDECDADSTHLMSVNYTGRSSPVNDTSPFDYQWLVPVSAVTSREPRRAKLLWLRGAQSAFFLDTGVDWFKLNANSSGFFRVNYDRSNWQKLAELLRRSDFHQHILSPSDRANLLDDALALMRADQLPADLALNLTLYLEVGEREYVPWEAAMAHFYTLDALMLSHPLLQRYVRRLLGPSVAQLGWRSPDSHLDAKIRQTLLYAASWFGDEPTERQARQYFDNCMRNGFQVPADLRLVVYSTGVRAGGLAEWNFCWAKYINTKVPSEQRLLLRALAHSRQPFLLSQLLTYALDRDKIRPQDAAHVLADVSANPVGRPLVWRFVREHWDRIVRSFGQGSFAMDEIIGHVAGHFASRFEHDEAQRFFGAVKLGAGAQAVQQTLERIRANVFWKERVERKVVQWLRSVPYA